MKKLKTYLPEIYFIAAILFYWISTANVVNWFAIGFLALIGVLIFTKNKILGIAFGVFFIFINLYMVLAMVSELSEFPEFNTDAQKLFFVGSLFIGLNLLFSSLLIIKYFNLESNKKIILQNK